MSTLVDPTICPDCRAPLDRAATCTGCGLRLVGPAAAELWQRMQQADQLVEQLRASGPVPAAVAPVAATAAPPRPAPTPAPPARRPALPSTSVPVVLLSLGGLCLLVAAIVFVAVAWSSLGLAAKTSILLVVTGAFGTAATVATRRALRFAAETLWVVVSGLVAIDLAAAYGADLLGLGRLSDRDAVALVGATLLGLGVAVGAWATTTGLRRLHCLVGVAAIGTLLLTAAAAWTSPHNPLAVAVSVPALAALALAIDTLTDRQLRPTAAVVGVSAVLSWLVLVGQGMDRLVAAPSLRAWWSDLTGWPVLAAAVLAAAVAALPALAGGREPLPDWLRIPAAGGALVTASLFVVGPGAEATADVLLWAAVCTALAAVSTAAPRVWALPAAVLTAAALVTWSGWSLVRPFAVLALLPASASQDNRLALELPAPAEGPAPWTAIVATLVVGATAAGLLRHLRTPGAREAAGRAWVALGPAALALGGATCLLESGPTLLVAVLVWCAPLAIAAVMAVTVRHQDAALAASLLFVAYLIGTGLRLTAPSHLLSAAFATAVALVLAFACARADSRPLAGMLQPVLAGSTVLSTAYAVAHWSYLAGADDDAVGVVVVAVAASALLAARPSGRGSRGRLAIEITAFLTGLAATALPDEPAVVATVLTLLGSAVAVVTVLNRDRDEAAWIGVALLGVATAIRVIEDVRAPELYTLPAAAVLLGAGWWRLAHDAHVGSVRALSSGLTLALAPSLLLALDEPVSLRGVLVAAAGVAALAVGIAQLWAAPFVAGAATTGALAVRHLGPVVEGLPRWISLGSVGLALLLVGITWEQRRRDADAASRYLASLR